MTHRKPDARGADPGAGGCRKLTGWKRPLNATPPNKFQAPIRAELTGSDRCTALGIEAHSPAPALALCRQLLAAGLDPDQAMEVYRGATLALRIRSIGEGARLTVRDDRNGTPRFVAYRPGPAERGREGCGEAPPVRSGADPDIDCLEAAE